MSGNGNELMKLEEEEMTSLEYLQTIYRDPLQMQATRVKAAVAALPFEYPKLSVAASVSGKGMATALEAAHRKVFAPRTQALIAAERDRDRDGSHE